MSEEWRNSEAQVITHDQWTRLNGTDAEILIPGRAAGPTILRVRRATAEAVTVPVGLQGIELSGPIAITEPGRYVYDCETKTLKKAG